MEKPVWRVNTGNGVPSDLGNLIVYGDGVIVPNDRDYSSNIFLWEPNDFKCCNIAIYQTTRTRKAKYEKVECGYCKGAGVLYHEEESNDNLKCYCCNGKGYRLEAL